MGAALELVTSFVTAPGATLTNATFATGNSATVRNAPFDKKVRLIQAWAQNQVAGTVVYKSPKLHDNVQGIRARAVTTGVFPLIPQGFEQLLVPQDVLTVQQSGSGVGGQIETNCFLAFYEDQPGVAARFMTAADVDKKIVNLFPVELTNAFGVAGGYSGEVAINSSFDLFKANTDYAVLGYEVSAACAAVRLRGADTGNLGVGGPGEPTLRHITSRWFCRLSEMHDLPLVPIINSANKAGTLCDGAQSQAGTSSVTTWFLAELAK